MPAFTEYLSTVNPAVWSVLTFLLGVLFGHWVALHRDKRKEYNEIVDRLRKQMLTSTHNSLSALDVDRLKPLMSFWKHRQLHRAIDSHHATLNAAVEQDRTGELHYLNEPEIERTSKALLRLLPRR
jgi:hypothetical protein